VGKSPDAMARILSNRFSEPTSSVGCCGRKDSAEHAAKPELRELRAEADFEVSNLNNLRCN
jgi:hypothetical protein